MVICFNGNLLYIKINKKLGMHACKGMGVYTIIVVVVVVVVDILIRP